jgi:phage head maturation protease
MMPTDTIKLLRDKVLLLLDHDLEYHINRWDTLREKIQSVAMEKGFILKDRDAN